MFSSRGVPGREMCRKRKRCVMSDGASGFGKDLGLVHEAVVTGRKVGAGCTFWAALAHDEDLFRRIVREVNSRDSYEVQVDYSQTLEEMIGGGNYDWVNPDIIEEHFPLQKQGTQEVEIHLFHFGRTMSNEAAEKEMEAKGFRPATLPELLALGRDHPDPQKQFPIVALGSVWRRPGGDSGTPILLWYGGERYLVLRWLASDWHGGCRFAVVRN